MSKSSIKLDCGGFSLIGSYSLRVLGVIKTLFAKGI